jgi:lipoyl(octanoyl) transferase
MPETWRLLTGTGRPAENMAVDAALAWAVGAGLAPPTLRVYRWHPPAVSVGYAQQRTVPLNLEACARAGLAVVRRPTGGRAVLHDGDVTYALALPRGGWWAERSLGATCRLIHEAVADGLRRLGVPAEVAGPRPSPGARPTPLCFAVLSAHEITVGGRKLVGSAQRRLRRAILQHGSIPLTLDRVRLAALLEGTTGTEAAAAWGSSMVSLAEVLGRRPDPEAVQAAIAAGVADAFQVRFAAQALGPEEALLAGRLEPIIAVERGRSDGENPGFHDLDTLGGVC